MARVACLKRRSFFGDERKVRRVKKTLGVATDAEAVRTAVERIAEHRNLLTWRG